MATFPPTDITDPDFSLNDIEETTSEDAIDKPRVLNNLEVKSLDMKRADSSISSKLVTEGPLHKSAGKGDSQALTKFLISEKRKFSKQEFVEIVNATGIAGRTALHRACQSKNSECVSLLLENGADVNARDDRGRTPLYWACLVPNNENIISLLLDVKTIDINLLTDDGSSVLHAVASINDESLFKKLIEHGAQPEVVNIHGQKPSELLIQTSQPNLSLQTPSVSYQASESSQKKGTFGILGSFLTPSSRKGSKASTTNGDESESAKGTFRKFGSYLRRASIATNQSSTGTAPPSPTGNENNDSVVGNREREGSRMEEGSYPPLSLFDCRDKFYKKAIPREEEDKNAKFRLISSIAALDEIETTRGNDFSRRLKVTVSEIKELKANASHYAVTVHCEDEIFITPVVAEKTESPFWGETFELWCKSPLDQVTFGIWNIPPKQEPTLLAYSAVRPIDIASNTFQEKSTFKSWNEELWIPLLNTVTLQKKPSSLGAHSGDLLNDNGNHSNLFNGGSIRHKLQSIDGLKFPQIPGIEKTSVSRSNSAGNVSVGEERDLRKILSHASSQSSPPSSQENITNGNPNESNNSQSFPDISKLKVIEDGHNMFLDDLSLLPSLGRVIVEVLFSDYDDKRAVFLRICPSSFFSYLIHECIRGSEHSESDLYFDVQLCTGQLGKTVQVVEKDKGNLKDFLHFGLSDSFITQHFGKGFDEEGPKLVFSFWMSKKMKTKHFLGHSYMILNTIMDHPNEIIVSNLKIYSRTHVYASENFTPVPIKSVPGKTDGRLRIKVVYSEEVIHPIEFYEPLEKWLEMRETWECLFAWREYKEDYVESLVRFYSKKKIILDVLDAWTVIELRSTENLSTLFRANSIMTKAFDLYFKMTGQFYLTEMLQDVVDQIYDPNTLKDCELNPKFMSKPEKSVANAAHAQMYADKLLNRMYKNVQAVPTSFKHIFSQLRVRMLERFPECKSQNSFYTSISAFLFLRFICPAILNPKLFKLRSELPPAKANRSLTIVAKLIQSIANLIPFGEKEPFMMVLNEYHAEQMPKFMSFINKLTTFESDDSFGPNESMIFYEIRMEYELAQIKRNISNLILEKQVETPGLSADWVNVNDPK